MNKTKRALIDYLWGRFTGHRSDERIIDKYISIRNLSGKPYHKIGKLSDKKDVMELLKFKPDIPNLITWVASNKENLYFVINSTSKKCEFIPSFDAIDIIENEFFDGLYVDYLKLILAEEIKDED